jgi:hypothetical protein
MFVRAFQQSVAFSAATAVIGMFTLVFGWSTWVGVDLWRGKPQAYKWAKVLFLLQVPIVNISSFAYHFYTGLLLSLALSGVSEKKLGFEFELASGMKFQIPSDIDDLTLGVNLVAFAALIYLVESKQKTSDHHPAAGGTN